MIAQGKGAVEQGDLHVLAALGGFPHQVVEFAALGGHLVLEAAPAAIKAPADPGANGGETGKEPEVKPRKLGEPDQDDDEHEGMAIRKISRL